MKKYINHPYLATMLYDTPLLILPEKASILSGVISGGCVDGIGAVTGTWLSESRIEREGTLALPQGVEHYQTKVGNHVVLDSNGNRIKVINVFGTLAHRTVNIHSGILSYESIRGEFKSAVDDADVDAILLHFDSPGGSVNGLFDLAQDISDYVESNDKEVISFVNEAAYSAAYALACSASRIYLTKIAGVGSVGVIAIHYEQSKAEEAAGLKFTSIFAGDCKNDFSQHEPLKKAALQRLQASVDRTYEIFVNYVAEKRNMTVESVKDTQAMIYYGEDAVKVGFADSVVAFSDIFS